MAPLTRFAAASLLAMAPVVAGLNALTYIGCYKASTGLSMAETYQYQSDGHCQEVCVGQENNAAVLGLTGGADCYCGSVLPPSSDLVSNSSCDTPCQGFGEDMCGGTNFWSVYLTGAVAEANVGTSDGSSATTSTSGSASTTSTSSPSVITSVTPGKTVVVTQAASTETSSASPSAGASKSGSSTTGIVVGLVVGLVVLGMVAGAAFFFIRRSRRRNAELSRQGNTSDFLAGGRKPAIPAMGRRSPLESESRFDSEAMAHRRLSDGSIADNEDYSRRILKVTNPEED